MDINMITIYQQIPGARGYESSDLYTVGVSIVELFVSQEPALIQRLRFIQQLQRKEAEDFGVNYGTRSSGRKAFIDEETVYEVNSQLQRITSLRGYDNLFYDRDKIPFQRHFIVEASIDEILDEFGREWRR